MRYATSGPTPAVSPTLQGPSLGELPLEIRQQTVRLLARLLREHGKIAANPAKEACDE